MVRVIVVPRMGRRFDGGCCRLVSVGGSPKNWNIVFLFVTALLCVFLNVCVCRGVKCRWRWCVGEKRKKKVLSCQSCLNKIIKTKLVFTLEVTHLMIYFFTSVLLFCNLFAVFEFNEKPNIVVSINKERSFASECSRNISRSLINGFEEKLEKELKQNLDKNFSKNKSIFFKYYLSKFENVLEENLLKIKDFQKKYSEMKLTIMRNSKNALNFNNINKELCYSMAALNNYIGQIYKYFYFYYFFLLFQCLNFDLLANYLFSSLFFYVLLYCFFDKMSIFVSKVCIYFFLSK